MAAGISKFHSGGFNGTGLDQIVKEAEVPKGSFYNFFDSKSAFAAEVIDLYFQRHRLKLDHYLSDSSLLPLERFRAYFDERIQFFTSLEFQRGCMMGNLSVETSDQNEDIRARLEANFEAWTDIFAATIREGQEKGDINSMYRAEEFAQFVLNSWEGAILRMKAEKSVRPLRNAASMLLDLMSGGGNRRN
ncbi:TetR family transcriptional regulator [Agrobacterium tumefaciens]|uniref:TetR/AcrR family transcriptional regulator n=1 Tax=Agrobacterium fabrum TaxID=1176649 RepID=UPI001571CA54|nr:TetR/AcrR family transcriptional regulator [Agrobacterium fabrum]NTE84567.1 TetR family transcriptional regulator [Agrobacterium tumefaciens]